MGFGELRLMGTSDRMGFYFCISSDRSCLVEAARGTVRPCQKDCVSYSTMLRFFVQAPAFLSIIGGVF